MTLQASTIELARPHGRRPLVLTVYAAMCYAIEERCEAQHCLSTALMHTLMRTIGGGGTRTIINAPGLHMHTAGAYDQLAQRVVTSLVAEPSCRHVTRHPLPDHEDGAPQRRGRDRATNKKARPPILLLASPPQYFAGTSDRSGLYERLPSGLRGWTCERPTNLMAATWRTRALRSAFVAATDGGARRGPQQRGGAACDVRLVDATTHLLDPAARVDSFTMGRMCGQNQGDCTHLLPNPQVWRPLWRPRNPGWWT